VSEWCEGIAARIKEYVLGVQDAKYLLKPQPPLQIAIPGGSSAVSPVQTKIEQVVRTALADRGVTNSDVKFLKPKFSAGSGGGYTETEFAQLAVCIGASLPHFAMLKHYADGLS